MTTTYVSPTELRATIPGAELALTGTRPVQVYTLGAGGGASSTLAFTVAPVQDVIVDNGQPGTSFTGTWTVTSAANAFGTDSLVSPGLGASTHRWTPTIPVAGSYEVFLWWPAEPSLAAAVPGTVVDSTGAHALAINQQAGAGQWQSLGTFAFSAGTAGYVEISDAGGAAVADAARFAPRFGGATVALTVSRQGSGTVTSSPAGIDCGSDCGEIYLGGSTVTLIPTPAPGSSFAGWSGDADCADGVIVMTTSKSCTATFAGSEVVIDDGQPGTSFTGSWSPSSAPVAYGTGALVSPGASGAAYRWTPTIPQTWQYQVYLWWPSDATLSPAAPVTVVFYEPWAYSMWSSTFPVSQQVGGGQWQLLGTFTFPAGTAGYVEISDANGPAAADAVRLVPFGPAPDPDPCAGGCGGGGGGGAP
jgi:hypothetical protein